jgi:hypothetical protein
LINTSGSDPIVYSRVNVRNEIPEVVCDDFGEKISIEKWFHKVI